MWNSTQLPSEVLAHQIAANPKGRTLAERCPDVGHDQEPGCDADIIVPNPARRRTPAVCQSAGWMIGWLRGALFATLGQAP